MTKYILFTILLILSSNYALANKQDTKKLMAEATEAFHQERYQEAINILTPLVEENNPLATYMTGILHYKLTPQGTPPTLALMYYEKAAKLGYTAAYLDIGFSYQEGNGLPRDYTEAFKYFTLAYKSNDTRAQALAAYAIGGLYLNGLSVKKSTSQAREWYKKSADLGYGDAVKMLKNIGNND